MSEVNVEELVQTMSAQRVEAMRASYEADLMAAWEKGKEAGKAEGISEGEFRGRKQGVIFHAMAPRTLILSTVQFHALVP